MAREDLTEERAEQALGVRLGRRRPACVASDALASPAAPRAQALLLAADAAQTAAFLVLLRAKGETPAEIAGLARAMRNSSIAVDAGPGVLDIVGTGGDRRAARRAAAGAHAGVLTLRCAVRQRSAGTVNISTGACVVAAAAGAKVAKHGNRSVSSMCGSGDVVEKLGVAVRCRRCAALRLSER